MVGLLRAWVRTFVAADSVAGTLGKVALLLASVIGLPVLFQEQLDALVWVPAWGFVVSRTWTVGWVALGLLALGYLLWTGGIAWVRSRGARLEVADALVTDTEFDLFRLPVRNSGDGVMIPTATLLWIEGDGGLDHEATLPLPMRWMHVVVPNSPHLSWNQQGSVDLVKVAEIGKVTEKLVFTGQFFEAHVLLQPAQQRMKRVVFCARIDVPGTRQRAERVFTFERDHSHPLTLRPIRLKHLEPKWWGRSTSVRPQ
jgi:hypothetical protein